MKKGFTVIECLVVIAIIGLLLTLVVTAFNNKNKKRKCNEGNKEFYKLISTKGKCVKEFDYCNYLCADNIDINLVDCTARCEIKKNYCLNK